MKPGQKISERYLEFFMPKTELNSGHLGINASLCQVLDEFQASVEARLVAIEQRQCAPVGAPLEPTPDTERNT